MISTQLPTASLKLTLTKTTLTRFAKSQNGTAPMSTTIITVSGLPPVV